MELPFVLSRQPRRGRASGAVIFLDPTGLHNEPGFPLLVLGRKSGF